MSWYVDSFQRSVTEVDDVTVVQIVSYRCGQFIPMKTEHAALFRSFINPEFISLIGFYLQTEFFDHESVSEDMVQMQVRIKEVLYVQSILVNEIFQRLFFLLIVATGVYHGSFKGCLLYTSDAADE